MSDQAQLVLLVLVVVVVLLLLRVVGRWLHRPRTGTYAGNLRTLGPPPPPTGPTTWVPYAVTCPTCKGGELGTWHELCETCGGAGVVLAYRADRG